MSRSENMRRIRSKNTEPELAVRKLLRSLGLTGYRIHRKELPGRPDIAWASRRLAIFVHGCFWHGHGCKEGIRKPKSNENYWLKKINRNVQRDFEQIEFLRGMGWKVLVIWECEIKDDELTTKKIIDFISG